MKKLIFAFLLTALITPLKGQIKFVIEKEMSFPDLSIELTDQESLADLKVQISKDVNFEKFTVGLTNHKTEADFLILKNDVADVKIEASTDVDEPDFTLYIDDNLAFPDITIKLADDERDDEIDFFIYNEKDTVITSDLVIALLPLICKQLNKEIEGLPIYDE